MTSYEIEITRTAEKQLKALPHEDRRRLAAAILALADDPRPRGLRKLTGYDDVFRVRVGRYRILYSISNRKLIIIILKIGHRRHVYRP
jgi:mRNA interferase RelE/StbE